MTIRGPRGPYRRKPIAERFWPKVEKSDGCWLWTGSTNLAGYGQLNQPGSPKYGRGSPLHAHRVSWEVHFGPIPEGMFVCHKCDVRLCVRPDHLFLGTHDENMADMSSKGRTSHRKLTAEQASEMRRLYALGIGNYRLGKMFGVRKSTARNITKGIHYKEAA